MFSTNRLRMAAFHFNPCHLPSLLEQSVCAHCNAFGASQSVRISAFAGVTGGGRQRHQKGDAMTLTNESVSG